MSVFSNNLLLGAGGQETGPTFDSTLIPNSIWMDGTSDKVTRTMSDSGDGSEFTLSMWIQANEISRGHAFLCSGDSGAYSSIRLDSDDKIYFQTKTGSQILNTTAVWRDNAWYHFLLSVDTSQSTPADRVDLYINGIAATLTGSYPPQDHAYQFNTNTLHEVGSSVENGLWRGSVAQASMIGTKSIQQGDFAVTDFLDTFTFGTNGSQYVPKSDADITTLVNTGGANSFMLSFDDSSNLGEDESDNSNNFDLTSISSANQSTNTPSKEYVILNQLVPSVGTLTQGNLIFSGSTKFTIGTLSINNAAGGVWYFEATIAEDSGSSEWAVGFVGLDSNINGSDITSASDCVLYTDDDNKIVDGTESSYGSGFSSGNTIGCELDLADNEVRFYNNSGVSLGTISNTFSSDLISICVRANGTTLTLAIDSSDWTHSTPTGAKEISTANFTAPSNQGIDFFNPVLYTGNGTAIGSGGKAVTGAGFEPGFVWIKNRDATDSHMLFDRVRTTTKYIESDSTDAEATDTESLTTFGSDGFTVGDNVAVNTNTEDYVSWNWGAASGAGSTTSPAGDLASTSIVASAKHFSTVSYTGTGSATTVGHGLGGAAEMIIVKNRDAADAWQVYHSGVASDAETDYLVLNTTAAVVDNADRWNDTAPTASVFSIGNGAEVNTNTEDYIAYCFRSIAGVCAVGSYTGNGNADGPLICTGFKPRFILIKISSSTGSWFMYDTVRSSSNEVDDQLLAEATTVETTGSEEIDILAEGFKIRNTDSGTNTSSATYVYLAMADIGGGGKLPPIYGE